MTENPETEKKAENGKRTTFDEISRKLVVAAVTAAVYAQDELSNFVDRMVEKGEIAEQEARRLVQEAVERREKLEKERAKAKTAGTTTAEEAEALEKKIEELKQQIEALKNGQPIPPAEGNPQ
jgi:polyhydroxyalkanoate synthesis regulator phasin